MRIPATTTLGIPYRSVIFDLDGTLFDSLEDLGQSMNEVLRSQGYPAHPIDSYRYFVGDGMRKLVSRALPPGLNEKPEIVATCLDLMRDVYGANWSVHSKLYPGVPEMLDQLVDLGLELCILSNKPAHLTRTIGKRFLNQWPFRLTLGDSGEFPLKPDPAGALAIAKEMACPPDAFLYLGDTGIDMKTAIAAGMHPVGCLWGFRGAEELKGAGAKLLLSHPMDLLLWIDEISNSKKPV